MYHTGRKRGFLILALIAIFGFSDASTNLALNRKPSHTFQNSGEYLIIRNARRFCERGTILHATDQIKVEDASGKCNGLEECSFFCQTGEKDYNVSGSRKVGGMIERVLSKEGDGIPRSSVNWLCSGQNWARLFVKSGWITGVKADTIRRMNPLFQFSVNTRADCEDGNLLDSAKNMPVSSSCEMCRNLKTCTFFTLSFVIDEKMMAMSTVTKFCKGSPKNLKGADGNLLAVLHVVDAEATEKGEKISKSTTPLYYYGGPITADHYYDDLQRGSIVPATKL